MFREKCFRWSWGWRTGAALLNSGIDKLIFTGSVATGKRIAQAAAARLLPVVLELGGKIPCLCWKIPTSMLPRAEQSGAFVNAGQACLSVERCYVQRKLYEPFLEACVRRGEAIAGGQRHGSGNRILVPSSMKRQLNSGGTTGGTWKVRGARVLTGGTRLPELGPNFYAPTVLADVTHEMKVMREETFGPVLPVMPFETEDEGIALANDSEMAWPPGLDPRPIARRSHCPAH